MSNVTLKQGDYEYVLSNGENAVWLEVWHTKHGRVKISAAQIVFSETGMLSFLYDGVAQSNRHTQDFLGLFVPEVNQDSDEES